MESATTDVTLKMKRFPLLFSPRCPCYAEIDPCYFFRGISLETLMESAFVDDFVVFWASILQFSPVFYPCYPELKPSGNNLTILHSSLGAFESIPGASLGPGLG